MRLNIRITGSAEDLLEKLANRLGVKHKDAVLDALAIYSHAARKMENGGRLGILDENDKFTEFVTPTLEVLVEKIKKERSKSQNHQLNKISPSSVESATIEEQQSANVEHKNTEADTVT